MDLVAKATYEGPVVIDSLSGPLSLHVWHECGSKITNVSLDLHCGLLVAQPFWPLSHLRALGLDNLDD
jgi:hypothetical protein